MLCVVSEYLLVHSRVDSVFGRGCHLLGSPLTVSLVLSSRIAISVEVKFSISFGLQMLVGSLERYVRNPSSIKQGQHHEIEDEKTFPVSMIPT